MTLRAMEKSYITTSLHSTSYPFASGKAVPSVSYKAMPSWLYARHEHYLTGASPE